MRIIQSLVKCTIKVCIHLLRSSAHVQLHDFPTVDGEGGNKGYMFVYIHE